MMLVVLSACFGSLSLLLAALPPLFLPDLPFSYCACSLCLCVHTSCVCVRVLQLQQTCASYPWRRGAVDDTPCAGTLTVRFRPAGPSFTAAVEATTTASSTWRTVRRSASGKPKVQNHIVHSHRFMPDIDCGLNNHLLICRSSSFEDSTVIVAHSSSAAGMLAFL